MDVNQVEIGLLAQDPGALIVKYQPIVTVIVQVYCNHGFYGMDERDDVVQYVNEKLLERIDRIRGSYNGISKLRTYFSAVIRNLVLEMIRRERTRDTVRLLEDHDHSLSYHPDQVNRLIIRQEIDRLEIVFSLFFFQRAKLAFCLKALLRIPLDRDDFLAYCPGGFPRDYDGVIRSLAGGRLGSDREVYRNLAQLVNYREGRQSSAEAVRKWIWQREEEMISLLNGDPPRANHDHVTLRLLLEKYFYQEQSNRSSFPFKVEISLDE